MRTINSIKIWSVTIQGFKSYRERTEYDFGDMTIISGDNGLGKSSVADALAYAFTGMDFFGEKKLDKLHNPETPEMEVTVKLVDEIGEIHSLTRTHKNSVSNISFDGYNVRQTNMNELFGEGDLFLSMFNPLYFIETLGKDGKDLIERMLPLVEHEAVLAALKEPIKSQMKDVKILSPETYVKNRREEIREQENELIYLQGQKDAYEHEANTEKKAMERLHAEMESVNGRIGEIEAVRDGSLFTEEDEERLTELYRQIDVLSADTNDSEEINKLNKSIYQAEAHLEKLNAAVYRSPYVEEIAKKEAELKVLYAEYSKLSDLVKNLQPGYTCPSCRHVIMEGNLQSVRSGIQEKLKLCVAEGTKAKSALESVQKRDESGRKDFKDKIDRDASFQKSRITTLKSQCEATEISRNFAENERNDTVQKINEEILAMEHKKVNGGLMAEQVQELSDLQQKKQSLEAQIEIHQSVFDKLNGPDRENDINAARQEIDKLTCLVNNALLYIGKKNELIFKDLNMNRVKILLYEIVKSTGEVKDTFNFTYNGREYKRLSLSEKIKAGLEITELIKKLSGKNYPTFIDNSESIGVIDNVRPESQLIFARFEKGRPLTVTRREMPLRKAG